MGSRLVLMMFWRGWGDYLILCIYNLS
uniref:Uncharacterized protein n=1 Tax=Rhizophora mucronata TaxID=61149 RepID=A0A2P2JZN8_RHIMU